MAQASNALLVKLIGRCDVDGVREELLYRNHDYGDALGNAM